MDYKQIIENLKKKFGKMISEVEIKSKTRVYITINPKSILEFAEYLYKDLEFRFIIASALDTKLGLEILYHFSYDPIGLIVNVHVILPRKKSEIDSLANMFDAANWIEREMHELFGIVFLNHPEPEKLISDGNWAEGVYPYRND